MSDNNDGAFLKIDGKRYYAAMWYVELPANIGNVLAALYRDEGETDFHLDYRFRYYRDDKFFESEDERSTFRGVMKGTPEEAAITMATTIFKTMSTLGGQLDRACDMKTLVLKTSDALVIMDQLVKQKFANVKAVGPTGQA